MSKRIELPEPDAHGIIHLDNGDMVFPAIPPGPDSYHPGKCWACSRRPRRDYPDRDKKRYHDTPEVAAAWLASRGYGPGRTNDA